MSNLSYVYIIQIINTNFYKIGISEKPRDRMAKIQVSMPFDLKLVHTKKMSSAKLIEDYIHNFFVSKHIRGEWFELNIEDINDIEFFLNKMDNETINEIKRKRKNSKSKFISSKLKRNKLEIDRKHIEFPKSRKTKFKAPRIIFDENNPDKRAFIVFYAKRQNSDKYKRFRLTGNINRIKNIKKKREALNYFRSRIEEALNKGYNPFKDGIKNISHFEI